jgi:signal transduction histidine kinase
VVEVSADGKNVDPINGLNFQAGTRFISFRYAAIFLSAPARVRYAYKLDGLNSAWIPAEDRKVVMYNALPHGTYRFTVRATLPNLTSQETTMDFQILPYFYQTKWFLFSSIACAFAMVYWAYQLRVRRIHSRFSLVLQERTRLAREIHDTLVQAFFGISSQLDVLSANLDGDRQSIRRSMDLARKMARHSLTEARRSVLDLRTIALDNEDLASALSSAASQWAEGTAVRIQIQVNGNRRKLPEQIVQNVLRVAQEAVTNALKHANPETIWVNLEMEVSTLRVSVRDDGRGFHHSDSFSASAGHFGLVGMSERAQRVGGQLRICSQVGTGTEVEIQVPL